MEVPLQLEDVNRYAKFNEYLENARDLYSGLTKVFVAAQSVWKNEMQWPGMLGIRRRTYKEHRADLDNIGRQMREHLEQHADEIERAQNVLVEKLAKSDDPTIEKLIFERNQIFQEFSEEKRQFNEQLRKDWALNEKRLQINKQEKKLKKHEQEPTTDTHMEAKKAQLEKQAKMKAAKTFEQWKESEENNACTLDDCICCKRYLKYLAEIFLEPEDFLKFNKIEIDDDLWKQLYRSMIMKLHQDKSVEGLSREYFHSVQACKPCYTKK
jgi:hypothetical protein